MTSPADPAPLMLFNSLTRSFEAFEPVHPGEARVYSCGPTVYNYAHLGNMRAYVFADTLEKAAAEKAQSIWDIARHYTEAFWEDIKALNIRQPAEWSIATDYVPKM